MNVTLSFGLLLAAAASLPAGADETKSGHENRDPRTPPAAATGPHAVARDAHCLMAGDLSFALAEDGGVRTARFADRLLRLAGPGGFDIEEVCRPRGEVRALGAFRGVAIAQEEAIRFAGAIPKGALELEAAFRSVAGGQAIEVAGEVTDRSGTDRAVRVRFTLPIDLRGWRWEGTSAMSYRIDGHAVYPSRAEEVHFLGRKHEGFSDQDHAVYPIRVNRLPFAVVCGADAGLALAIPLHEPRVYLIQAAPQGFSITFSLGLTAATEKMPGRAGFRFVIYPVDAAWGLRSAAERYRAFNPDLFASRATRHGNYGTTWNPDREAGPDSPSDFALAHLENDFQWRNGEMSASEAKLFGELGATIYHWREPWSWFHAVPQEISADEQLALLRAQADERAGGGHGTNQYCGAPPRVGALAALNSYVLNADGKLARNQFTFRCWSLPMNCDPDLPAPNRATLALDWQYRYLSRWSEPGFRGPRNVAWDSLDDWSGFRRLNFRREHFRYTALPLTFDPETGELCQVVGFHDWSFARRHAEMVRGAGGLIMANVSQDLAILYCGRWVDVFVQERSVADYSDERLSSIRMMIGPKPLSFIGSRQPNDPAGLEATLRRLLLFGMAPGSEKAPYERALYRKYMPMIARVASAGWQPVPHARAEGAGEILLERFGGPGMSHYLAAGNRGGRPARARIVLDAAPLGLDGRAGAPNLEEILEGRPLSVRADAKSVEVELDLAAGETLVLSLPGSHNEASPRGEIQP